MSQDATTDSPESSSDVTSTMNFEDTELTLRLPGEGRSPAAVSRVKSSAKRGFIETVDLNLGSSCSRPRQHVSENSETVRLPAAKAQVAGWPPVGSLRKKVLEKGRKLVKVAVDGAAYLRKVDLELYSSYQDLLRALDNMFTIQLGNYMEDKLMLMGPVKKGMEYVATYEDKDGDWMLVGDVPWKMFIESCKRIRLMKSSEAAGLASRTAINCSSPSRKLKQYDQRIQE